LRIKHAVCERQLALTGPNGHETDEGTSRHYDKIVVLVDLVDGMQGIKITPVPVSVGLYFIDKEPLRTGEGRLYGVELGPIRYKTFPIFMEGEKQIPSLSAPDARSCGRQMIKSRAKVVHGITDNQGEAVWNWLRWRNDNALAPLVLVHRNRVEAALGEGGDFG
jgi:hypothetical protein